jgi:hypothetical protein
MKSRHLAEAFKQGRVGRFQLEAAIQSVHAERACSGRTDWAAIALFYEQLVRISTALGTRCVALSAVLGCSRSPPAATWEKFVRPQWPTTERSACRKTPRVPAREARLISANPA